MPNNANTFNMGKADSSRGYRVDSRVTTGGPLSMTSKDIFNGPVHSVVSGVRLSTPSGTPVYSSWGS